jgi:PAS domain S-box-containing protein
MKDSSLHPELAPDQVALNHILQTSQIGLITAAGPTIVEVNEPICKLTGYTQPELVGQPTRILHSSGEEPLEAGVAPQVLADGWATLETQLRCKNGSLLDIHLTFGPANAGETDGHVVYSVTANPLPPEKELFWQNRELTAFHRISEVMLSGQDEQSVFNTIAQEAGEMAGFPMVSIELCDFDRAVMIYQGSFGLPLNGMPTPFEVPMDVTLSGQVAYTGKVLIETQVSLRREYSAPILRYLGVQTLVCVPIKSDGAVVGTLTLSHVDRIHVEPRVVKAATSLANFIATLFDRLKARETLRRNEVELSTIYDRVPSALCFFDEQLQIIRVNRAAIEYAARDSKPQPLQRFADFFQCDSIGNPNTICTKGNLCLSCELQRALRDTLTSGHSLRQVKMSKKRRFKGEPVDVVLLVSTERIQMDNMVRVLMCLEDITKSVHADEQIRAQAALLDITREAIFVRDFTGRITYWNEGAHRLYGWHSADVLGKTITELDLVLDQQEAMHALEAVQKNEEWVGEMRQKTKDGRELVVQTRWTLMHEPDGRPLSILVVNTDVTDRKHLETQLLRSQRLESIGTLASGLAHDLNNVLAPIMMAVQFLRESTQDEGSLACLQTLETCSRRGADIIRQVLMFARGVEGERILINPKHLIREMERIARETFPRAIEIFANIPRDPCIFMGDATQIQQILMNLCVNARDAMPNGGSLTISLDKEELDGAARRLHPKARPGLYVVISVVDTGKGIPRDLMEKIFDPFFTTKPLGQGTGLGLPTVLGIAESHGGFVHLTSELGKGSQFKVYIPAALDKNEKVTAGRSPQSLSKGHGEMILVVDDEPGVRRLISAILNRNGYRTVVASHGNEGLSVFEQQPKEIRLVVSDLMMPQLDGLGMIQSMRRLYPDTKAIIITGLGEEHRINEARAAGADAVLSKPFTADQLLSVVQQLMFPVAPPEIPRL